MPRWISGVLLGLVLLAAGCAKEKPPAAAAPANATPHAVAIAAKGPPSDASPMPHFTADPAHGESGHEGGGGRAATNVFGGNFLVPPPESAVEGSAPAPPSTEVAHAAPRISLRNRVPSRRGIHQLPNPPRSARKV